MSAENALHRIPFPNEIPPHFFRQVFPFELVGTYPRHSLFPVFERDTDNIKRYLLPLAKAKQLIIHKNKGTPYAYAATPCVGVTAVFHDSTLNWRQWRYELFEFRVDA